jgi:DNA-binding HxlR family transcriptional regulator
MAVISKTKLTEYGRDHADIVEAINDWWDKAKAADWVLTYELCTSAL